MNIVQTFWPNQKGEGSVKHIKAGWLSPMFHYMSWSLSCNLLLKNFQTIRLFTTKEGITFFQQVLDLPYDYQLLAPSDLSFPKELWALSKISVYGRQNEPFIHVDGDVFNWDVNPQIVNKSLIVQNFEKKFPYNTIAILKAVEYNLQFPDFIARNLQNDGSVDSINAGTIGGTDVAFFKQYSTLAFQFYKLNEQVFLNNNITNHFNCLIEQILFYCLAKEQNKEVDCLLEKQITHDYKDISSFEGVPYAVKYVHPVGSYKRNRKICLQLSQILEREFPEAFERIISYYKTEYNYWFDLRRIYDKPTEAWMDCRV